MTLMKRAKVICLITCPESHWSKIRTTNQIERLNEEIRRVEKRKVSESFHMKRVAYYR